MAAITRLIPVFTQTILPVLLVAGVGWIVSRRMELEARTLGRVLFYLATPALVFRSLYNLDVGSGSIFHVALVSGLVTILASGLGWVVSWGMARRERAAITLTSGISNNGNMGLPICLFAFGETGLSLASVYYVTSSIINNTAGAVVASAGSVPIRSAVSQILRVPVLYAALIGAVLGWTGLRLPVGIYRSVDILAGAAVPCMLIMLGIQLGSAELLRHQTGVTRSVLVRLVAAPIIATIACALIGIVGMERNVIIAQAAMPTAVITSVLATEYDAAPRLVATVILMTTLFSILTLSVILTLLG